MKKVLLDTSFILNAVKSKIDFIEELFLNGFQILIPNKVIKELQKVSKSYKKLKFRNNAKIALEILKKAFNEKKLKKISLKGRNVDSSIAEYLNENSDIFLASTDKELNKKVKNRKVILRYKKIEF